MPYLTSEEIDVYKRARNTKKGTRAKHATVTEYNKSTGFEALIGYLYLLGEIDRLEYLLSLEE
jgi:ribonuclease-3 family protein